MRTLVLLITALCTYLASWGPTQHYGVPDVRLRIHGTRSALQVAWLADEATAIAPLIVRMNENTGRGATFQWQERYYLWLFGLVVRLPVYGDTLFRMRS